MVLTPIVVAMIIGLGFSTINHCLSVAIPSSTTTSSSIITNATQNNTASLPTHILRVRIRVHNCLIETSVNEKQLDLIEAQLRQRLIPYRQIQDNKDGVTIMIGPFHNSINSTAIIAMFNQSDFHINFSKLIRLNTDHKNQTNVTIHSNETKIHSNHYPFTVEAQAYNLAQDKETYEFRNCLEACEVYIHKELQPDHDCIRKKCFEDITGI